MTMIPNLLTISGIIATLIYVACYLTGHVYIAIGAVAWIMISDFLDGKVARALDQVTAMGAALDPIRDRMFLVAALGNFVYLYGVHAVLNVWVVAIIMAEFLTFLVYGITLMHVGSTIKVNFFGKMRQIGHLILIGIAIIDAYFHISTIIPIPTLDMTFKLMAFLSIAALCFYFGRAYTIWQKPKNR